MVESVLMGTLIDARHLKQIVVVFPAQCLLYLFLLGTLALIFRRYYGRPFWLSLRWVSSDVSTAMAVGWGVAVAFSVMVISVLMKTPDIDSPMKTLLSDPTSVLLVALLGTTIGPVCEEIVFRGFLQPLVVRSLGVVPGCLLYTSDAADE